MQSHLIKSTRFFQDLLSSYFQRITSQVVETLVLLCVCHLFGLYNPNQVADALRLPKAGLYRRLGSLSLYHSKALNLRLGSAMAVDFIRDAESKSASTQSRRCITLSVDDSNLPRETDALAYCSKMMSTYSSLPNLFCYHYDSNHGSVRSQAFQFPHYSAEAIEVALAKEFLNSHSRLQAETLLTEIYDGDKESACHILDTLSRSVL